MIKGNSVVLMVKRIVLKQ